MDIHLEPRDDGCGGMTRSATTRPGQTTAPQVEDPAVGSLAVPYERTRAGAA